MTTIDPRDPKAMNKAINAIRERKPYVQVKDLRGTVEAIDKAKGGRK